MAPNDMNPLLSGPTYSEQPRHAQPFDPEKEREIDNGVNEIRRQVGALDGAIAEAEKRVVELKAEAEGRRPMTQPQSSTPFPSTGIPAAGESTPKSPVDYSSPEESKPESILEEANRIINGQRRRDYGDEKESFARLAGLFAAYLGIPITPNDVVELMILVKVSRAKNGFHRDSFVDIAGYAALSERL